MEGIAFEQLLALNAVESRVGTKVKELVAIGGGATNALWCHIMADITERTICIPKSTEASALGAAVTAAVGMNWYHTAREAAGKMTGIAGRIRPEKKNRKRYEKLFAMYRRIYPALKSVQSV